MTTNQDRPPRSTGQQEPGEEMNPFTMRELLADLKKAPLLVERELKLLAGDHIEYGVEVFTVQGIRAMTLLWEGQEGTLDGETWTKDRTRAQKNLRKWESEPGSGARIVTRRVSTSQEEEG